MNVELRPEIQRFLEAQIEGGAFESADEVIEVALARLMLDPHPDVLDGQDLNRLRTSLDQMRRREVLDWEPLAARLRKQYLDA
jgi:Arc/MetJ-type ribon-helix-helix transcriptional regulator